jgi:hypothetical protein
VKIEIEDENAKYPLNWALITDEKWKALAETGLATFCEWMGYTPTEITGVREDLGKIGEFRSYQLEFKPLTKTAAPPSSLRSRVSRPPSRPGGAASAPALTKTVTSGRADGTAERGFRQALPQLLCRRDLLSRPTSPATPEANRP